MNEEYKFDTWNQIKKKLSLLQSYPFPKEGEVWMSFLGKNIGYEQDGVGKEFLRPVLIIKKFNTHMFWGIPLSTKQKTFDFYYNFTDPHNEKVSVILAQLKLVSVERLERRMYSIQNEHLDNIRDKLHLFLD